MISSNSDVYLFRKSRVLDVCSESSGLLTAILSKSHATASYEVSLWLHINGMIKVHTQSFPLIITPSNNKPGSASSKWKKNGIIWHPSGKKLCVITDGSCKIFSVMMDDLKMGKKNISLSRILDDKEDGRDVDASPILDSNSFRIKMHIICEVPHQVYSACLYNSIKYLLLGLGKYKVAKLSWEGYIVGYYSLPVGNNRAICRPTPLKDVPGKESEIRSTFQDCKYDSDVSDSFDTSSHEGEEQEEEGGFVRLIGWMDALRVIGAHLSDGSVLFLHPHGHLLGSSTHIQFYLRPALLQSLSLPETDKPKEIELEKEERMGRVLSMKIVEYRDSFTLLKIVVYPSLQNGQSSADTTGGEQMNKDRYCIITSRVNILSQKIGYHDGIGSSDEEGSRPASPSSGNSTGSPSNNNDNKSRSVAHIPGVEWCTLMTMEITDYIYAYSSIARRPSSSRIEVIHGASTPSILLLLDTKLLYLDIPLATATGFNSRLSGTHPILDEIAIRAAIPRIQRSLDIAPASHHLGSEALVTASGQAFGKLLVAIVSTEGSERSTESSLAMKQHTTLHVCNMEVPLGSSVSTHLEASNPIFLNLCNRTLRMHTHHSDNFGKNRNVGSLSSMEAVCVGWSNDTSSNSIGNSIGNNSGNSNVYDCFALASSDNSPTCVDKGVLRIDIPSDMRRSIFAHFVRINTRGPYGIHFDGKYSTSREQSGIVISSSNGFQMSDVYGTTGDSSAYLALSFGAYESSYRKSFKCRAPSGKQSRMSEVNTQSQSHPDHLDFCPLWLYCSRTNKWRSVDLTIGMGRTAFTPAYLLSISRAQTVILPEVSMRGDLLSTSTSEEGVLDRESSVGSLEGKLVSVLGLRWVSCHTLVMLCARHQSDSIDSDIRYSVEMYTRELAVSSVRGNFAGGHRPIPRIHRVIPLPESFQDLLLSSNSFSFDVMTLPESEGPLLNVHRCAILVASESNNGTSDIATTKRVLTFSLQAFIYNGRISDYTATLLWDLLLPETAAAHTVGKVTAVALNTLKLGMLPARSESSDGVPVHSCCLSLVYLDGGSTLRAIQLICDNESHTGAQAQEQQQQRQYQLHYFKPCAAEGIVDFVSFPCADLLGESALHLQIYEDQMLNMTNQYKQMSPAARYSASVNRANEGVESSDDEDNNDDENRFRSSDGYDSIDEDADQVTPSKTRRQLDSHGSPNKMMQEAMDFSSLDMFKDVRMQMVASGLYLITQNRSFLWLPINTSLLLNQKSNSDKSSNDTFVWPLKENGLILPLEDGPSSDVLGLANGSPLYSKGRMGLLSLHLLGYPQREIRGDMPDNQSARGSIPTTTSSGGGDVSLSPAVSTKSNAVDEDDEGVLKVNSVPYDDDYEYFGLNNLEALVMSSLSKSGGGFEISQNSIISQLLLHLASFKSMAAVEIAQRLFTDVKTRRPDEMYLLLESLENTLRCLIDDWIVNKRGNTRALHKNDQSPISPTSRPSSLSLVSNAVTYTNFVRFLFAVDPLLLIDLLSNLGRKLDPNKQQQLLPVALPGVVPIRSSLSIYEDCLQRNWLVYASRMLTLACDYVGGTEDFPSTLECLSMALELLDKCLRNLSMNLSLECLAFCSRFEDILQSMALQKKEGDSKSTGDDSSCDANVPYRRGKRRLGIALEVLYDYTIGSSLFSILDSIDKELSPELNEMTASSRLTNNVKSVKNKAAGRDEKYTTFKDVQQRMGQSRVNHMLGVDDSKGKEGTRTLLSPLGKVTFTSTLLSMIVESMMIENKMLSLSAFFYTLLSDDLARTKLYDQYLAIGLSIKFSDLVFKGMDLKEDKDIPEHLPEQDLYRRQVGDIIMKVVSRLKLSALVFSTNDHYVFQNAFSAKVGAATIQEFWDLDCSQTSSAESTYSNKYSSLKTMCQLPADVQQDMTVGHLLIGMCVSCVFTGHYFIAAQLCFLMKMEFVAACYIYLHWYQQESSSVSSRSDSARVIHLWTSRIWFQRLSELQGLTTSSSASSTSEGAAPSMGIRPTESLGGSTNKSIQYFRARQKVLLEEEARLRPQVLERHFVGVHAISVTLRQFRFEISHTSSSVVTLWQVCMAFLNEFYIYPHSQSTAS